MARCVAIMKDGEQCPFTAQPGSKRCGHHGVSFHGTHKKTVKKAAKKAAKKKAAKKAMKR